MLSHLVMAFAFAADVERCSTADDVCLLQLKQAATSTTAALSYLEGDELDPSSTVIAKRGASSTVLNQKGTAIAAEQGAQKDRIIWITPAPTSSPTPPPTPAPPTPLPTSSGSKMVMECPLARLKTTGYPPDRKIADFAEIISTFLATSVP